MSRTSPWDSRFKRPNERVETKAFSHPDFPETEFAFTLLALDELTQAVAADRAQDYERQYIDGANGHKAFPLLGPDGKRLPMSRSMCRTVACLQEMEQAPEGEQAYGLVDWLGLCRNVPQVWEQVLLWCANLNNPEEPREPEPGNASGASSTTSSYDLP